MAGRERSEGSEPSTEQDDEGFLGRWSRRKADVKSAETQAAVDPADLLNEDDASSPPAMAEPEDTPAFDVSTLPDIDSLGPGSDFSMFMQTGVPPALKTKALRKLWRVKPDLANLDGLLDYGEDLTGSFKVVDHLKTAYEVGRGFLRDQDEDSETKADTDDTTDDDIASTGGDDASDRLRQGALSDDDASMEQGAGQDVKET